MYGEICLPGNPTLTETIFMRAVRFSADLKEPHAG
jgi:hypothetical protein